MRHLFTSLVLCLNLVAGLIWNTTYPIPPYLGGAMDCISKEWCRKQHDMDFYFGYDIFQSFAMFIISTFSKTLFATWKDILTKWSVEISEIRYLLTIIQLYLYSLYIYTHIHAYCVCVCMIIREIEWSGLHPVPRIHTLLSCFYMSAHFHAGVVLFLSHLHSYIHKKYIAVVYNKRFFSAGMQQSSFPISELKYIYMNAKCLIIQVNRHFHYTCKCCFTMTSSHLRVSPSLFQSLTCVVAGFEVYTWLSSA